MINRLLQLEHELHRRRVGKQRSMSMMVYQFSTDRISNESKKNAAMKVLERAVKNIDGNFANSDIWQRLKRLAKEENKQYEWKISNVQVIKSGYNHWLVEDLSNKATIQELVNDDGEPELHINYTRKSIKLGTLKKSKKKKQPQQQTSKIPPEIPDEKKTARKPQLPVSGTPLPTPSFSGLGKTHTPPQNLQGYQPVSKISKTDKDYIHGLDMNKPPFHIFGPGFMSWEIQPPEEYHPDNLPIVELVDTDTYISSGFKNYLLASHNEARRQAWGKPMDLEWHPSLATLAQHWAERLIQTKGNGRGHQFHRPALYRENVPGLPKHKKKNTVGENKAGGGDGEKPSTIKNYIDRAFNGKWYNDEVDLYYPKKQPRNQDYPDAGHYLNLIWKNTKYMGGGLAVRKNADGSHQFHIVVNFWPTRYDDEDFKEMTPQKYPGKLNIHGMWITN